MIALCRAHAAYALALALAVAACDTQAAGPRPLSIVPESAPQGVRTRVHVRGERFHIVAKASFDEPKAPTVDARFRLFLGDHALEDVVRASAKELYADVPAELSPGTYDVHVIDPRGNRGVLPGAFTLLSGTLWGDGGVDGPSADLSDGASADGPGPDSSLPDASPPDLTPPPCGNGALDPTETCDDKNTNGGDGCSSSCQIEDGYLCPTPGQGCTKAQSATFDTAKATDQPNIGGTGGNAFQRPCASGELVVGVGAKLVKNSSSWYPDSLTELEVRCRTYELATSGALLWKGSSDNVLVAAGTLHGSDTVQTQGTVRCDKDQFVVKLEIHPAVGSFVQGVALDCAPLSIKLGVLTAGTTKTTSVLGLKFPATTSQSCPAKTFPIGLSGRAGNVVDALALRCADVALQ